MKSRAHVSRTSGANCDQQCRKKQKNKCELIGERKKE